MRRIDSTLPRTARVLAGLLVAAALLLALPARTFAQPCGPAPMDFPDSLDWRELDGFNWVSPPKDGGTCGASWAFATVGVVESIVAFRTSTPTPARDLSEQQLLDCVLPVGFECAQGLTWDVALVGPGQVVSSPGLTTETCYPYTGTKASCQSLTGACATNRVQAELVTLGSTSSGLDPRDPDDFTMNVATKEEVMTCLLQRPVGASMRRFSDLDAYTGGVYAPAAGATRGDVHSVVLVGWGYDGTPHDDAHMYWIAKNNKGAAWGESGFFKIRYNAASIGMYSFFYEYEETDHDPKFCDLPASIAVVGANPDAYSDLKISNCGGGVLKWYSTPPSWLQIDDPWGAAVTAGGVVAAGTTYRLHVRSAVEEGRSAQLVLDSEFDGPHAINVYTVYAGDGGVVLPDATPPGDAAGSGADARPVDGGDDDGGGDTCGCRAGGRHGPATGAALLLGLALLAALPLARRRRG